MRLSKLIVGGAFLLPTIAFAEDTFSGNNLLTLCENPSAGQAGGLACGGYVLGYLQALADDQKGDVPVCLPNGVTGGQGYGVILKFMTDHPDELQKPANVIVRVALALAFRCKKPN